MIYDSRQNLAPNHYIPTSSGSTTGTVHGSSSRAEQQRDPPQQSGASSSEADSSSSEAHSSSSSATAARPGNPRRYSYTLEVDTFRATVTILAATPTAIGGPTAAGISSNRVHSSSSCHWRRVHSSRSGTAAAADPNRNPNPNPFEGFTRLRRVLWWRLSKKSRADERPASTSKTSILHKVFAGQSCTQGGPDSWGIRHLGKA